MMKNIILLFALTAVFGLCCGMVYSLTLGSEDFVLFEESAAATAAVDEQPEAPEEEEPAERQIRSGKNRTPDIVTNKSKICSVPGCSRSVFVTYRGRELCVKCYADEKKADTEAQQEDAQAS